MFPLQTKLKALESKLQIHLDKHLNTYLRIVVALVYIWFGALKLVSESPAEEFAKQTVEFTGFENELFALIAIWEVLLGFTFVFKKLTRVSVVLFFLHISATFMPFLTIPDLVFHKAPLELTLEGQYILKNFLLIGVVLSIYKRYLESQR